MLGALAFGAAQHRRLDRERDAAAATDRALWTGAGREIRTPPRISASTPSSRRARWRSPIPASTPMSARPPGSRRIGRTMRSSARRATPASARGSADCPSPSCCRRSCRSSPFCSASRAFAGERERGTLRQLAEPRRLRRRYSCRQGARRVRALVGSAPSRLSRSPCSRRSSLADHDFSVADQLQRLLALSSGYGLYLAGFVFLALAVSALAKSTRTALVILLAFWLANCFLAPRLMTDLAERAAPLPTALRIPATPSRGREEDLRRHDEQHPAFVAFRDGCSRTMASRASRICRSISAASAAQVRRERLPDLRQHFSALQTGLRRARTGCARRRASCFRMLAMQPFSTSFSGTDSCASV